MARADRTRSFVMPAAAVQELLKKQPQDPALAQVRRAEEMAALPLEGRHARAASQPGGEERMRHHLTEMQRLMDFMREEMDALETPDR